LIIVIGEILFDHFPEYRRLGGAPFNFAYHLKQMGLPIRFITRIGKDPEGKEILDILRQYRFNLDDVQIDTAHPTGRVTVALDAKGVPVFDIQPDVAYDYLSLPKIEPASGSNDQRRLIYFGSLIQRTRQGFKTVQKFLSSLSENDKCLCDINLRPGGYNDTIVLDSVKQADILKLNEDELGMIRQITDSDLARSDFVRDLMDRYVLEMVSLTKGDRGSELYIGGERYAAKTETIGKIADTVGAGDAYAAMVAIGYLKGWDPNRILSIASRFSGRLCTVQGAIPPLRFYDAFKTIG